MGQLTVTDRAIVFVGATATENIPWGAIVAVNTTPACDYRGQVLPGIERIAVHRRTGQPVAFSVDAQAYGLSRLLSTCVSNVSATGRLTINSQVQAALDQGVYDLIVQAAMSGGPDACRSAIDEVALLLNKAALAGTSYAGTSLERAMTTQVRHWLPQAKRSVLWDPDFWITRIAIDYFKLPV